MNEKDIYTHRHIHYSGNTSNIFSTYSASNGYTVESLLVLLPCSFSLYCAFFHFFQSFPTRSRSHFWNSIITLENLIPIVGNICIEVSSSYKQRETVGELCLMNYKRNKWQHSDDAFLSLSTSRLASLIWNRTKHGFNDCQHDNKFLLRTRNTAQAQFYWRERVCVCLRSQKSHNFMWC